MFKWLLDFITPTRTNVSIHVHEWGMWSTWATTYQVRQCKICGWQELERLY